MEDYRAPVPATLAGARVLTTAEAGAIWRAKTGVFIDVLPRAPKPQNLPEGTVWRDKPRLNIPGSVWLPDTGYGKLAAATEDYLRRGLVRASGGQHGRAGGGLLPGRLLDVLECGQANPDLTDYANVAWYPEGTDGWERAGLDSDGVRRPEPRAGEAAAQSPQ